MRVQASLIINDTELYESIIQPLKETREFNFFLVQLLQAYKEDYNGLRSYFGEESDYVSSETKDFSDVYGGIIESVAVMDTLLTDGENMLGGAIDSFAECIDKAKEQGIIRETETKNGNKDIQLALEVTRRPEETIKEPIPESDLSLVLSEIRNLAEQVNTISRDVENLKRQQDNRVEKVEEKTEKDKVVYAEPTVTVEVEEEPTFFVDDSKNDFEVPDEDTEEVTFEAEESESHVGEASEAMSDLLSSLLG